MAMIHQTRKAAKTKEKHDNNSYSDAASLDYMQRYLCQWTEYFNAE